MIDISIIIVNWNTQKLLEQCINSIQCSIKKLDYEILIVDNASTEGDLRHLPDSYSNVSIIYNQENVGFARANNQAARVAIGKYMLFLNPDTIVQPEAINKLSHIWENIRLSPQSVLD
jgi:GT2 family glycosyltransferase